MAHTTAASYNLRTFDFKLLEETLGADGDLDLRTSNEAVNVLVGALDVDLEAAHIAADVRLGILIRRACSSSTDGRAERPLPHHRLRRAPPPTA